jgi:hypothetical protein
MKTMSHLAGKTLAFLLSITAATAQQSNPPPAGGSYNPYLIQGIVSPAPMLPAEFNGEGNLIFDVGNTGSSEIVWVTDQEMLLIISLSYGVPNVANPNDAAQAITAVSGPGAEWFNWSYDSATRTFTATQKANIPAKSRRTINIAYKVTQNSFAQESFKNGFNCNISPPAYTNSQSTDDDRVNSYTYVEALDYGDAPVSYGSAHHKIDLSMTSGVYNKYIYLGSGVDPDTVQQNSPDASGDDSNQTGGLNGDDESGVTFPATMLPGTTVQVPVTVGWQGNPISGGGIPFLNMWIDFDGNGAFSAGERITTNQFVMTPGVVTVPVVIPANAATGVTLCARVRLGSSINGPTDDSLYGEVEDYQIFIGTTSGTVTGRIYHDVNGNGAKESTEPYLPNISVSVTDAINNPHAVVTDANGYWSALVPPGNATVDIDNFDPDLPAGTVLKQGTDPRSVTILSQQNVDGGMAGFGLAGYPAWQLSNNTMGAMDQDHDQDGVANGIEYFLVGPQANSTGLTTVPSIEKQNGILSVSWTKASTYMGSYITHFVVETSINLQNWTPEPLGTHVTINGNQIKYTFPTPYADKKFVRLRVSGP